MQVHAGAAFGYEVIGSKDGSILLRKPVRDDRSMIVTTAQPARDPFNWAGDALVINREQSPRSDDAIFANIHLSGILFDEKMPLAIIDDSLVKEGDIISGVVVRSISQNEVVVEHEQQLHTLRFSELFSLDAVSNTTKK
jgi:hypothetical protein